MHPYPEFLQVASSELNELHETGGACDGGGVTGGSSRQNDG